MSVEYQDYYSVLGVARDASSDDIQSAYRKLARKQHPDVDKSAGSTQRFQKLTEAYEVLKDPAKRKRYDALGANWQEGQEFTPPEGFGRRRHAHGGARQFDGFEGGFSSFFESFFADAPNADEADELAFGRGARAGGDLRAEVELQLEDLLAGATRTLHLDGGAAPRTLEVKIKPNTAPGTVMRLRGQGARGRGGAPAGDLLLTVVLAPHARYRVQGDDLELDLRVSVTEAALGARVPVRHASGAEFTLTVPPASSSGRKLRLRGQGLPRRGGERGDLIVVLQIALPPNIGEAEAELYRKLGDLSSFDPRA